MGTPRRDVLDQTNQTDREKILHALIVELSYSATHYKDPGDTVFAHVVGYRAPRPGELVVGMCGEVGWLVSITQPEGTADRLDTVYTVRPIGRDYVVDWSNETFKAIAGIYPPLLLEGTQRAFYGMVEKAMNEHPDGYQYKFAGVEFVGSDAVVKLRVRWTENVSRYPIENWEGYIDGPDRLIAELLSQGWSQKAGDGVV